MTLGLLRFCTCGSVDDGKSTMIGRLLHDSHMVHEDHLEALHKDSASIGKAGEHLDLALLTDGLRAEREQGITIDVAYRYFSTSSRKFIIADAPGHEQYTRNMVTAASTAQLAIILVDAQSGMTTQTRRHSYITSLLGIRSVVVAINKMDLVGFDQDLFEQLRAEYNEIVCGLPYSEPISEPVFIPMSALHGDGVVTSSQRLGWYTGPTLLEHLESVDLESSSTAGVLRLPVQLVIRGADGFRGYAGTIVSGTIRPGEVVCVEPLGRLTSIERLVGFDHDLEAAGPARAVTVTSRDELDIGRGDVIVGRDQRLQRANEVEVTLVWLSDVELAVGREYLIQHGHRRVAGRVLAIRSRIDMHSFAEEPAQTLGLNDIARATLQADAALLFDSYDRSQALGSLILIDRLSNATVAAGMIAEGAAAWDTPPGEHLARQSSEVNLSERTDRYGQRPVTIFITGLTGAGKSTIGKALERRLFNHGRSTVRLDGENMRLGVSKDLGFSSQDRSENVRRTAEIAGLVNNQGLIAVAALVAPQAAVRDRARQLIGADRFIEVLLDPPLEVCRARDRAGLYEAADRGEILRFPGVSTPYEKSVNADLVLDTSSSDVDSCVERIMALLRNRGFLSARGKP